MGCLRNTMWLERFLPFVAILSCLCGQFCRAMGCSGNPSIAGHYVVIVQTVTTETEGLNALPKWERYGPILACTDSLSGLKPGYYVIIESVHSARKAATLRCRELESKGIDCYVRYTGRRIIKRIPTLEEAKRIVKDRYPKNTAIELAATIDARGKAFPVMVLSYPVEERVHCYEAYENDYRIRVLLFLGTEPIEVRRHGLLKPGDDDIWEGVSCTKIKQLPLSNSKSVPTTIAQHCITEGLCKYRFMIFDDCNLHDPAKDVATWSFVVEPHAEHQVFVPNDDPDLPQGISELRGDGKTVLEGTEGKMISEDNTDGFLVRGFTAVWENVTLLFHYGPWERVE